MRKITVEDYKQPQIAEDLLKEVFERNLFKMFVPKEYGGLELDLKTASHYITETAAHFGGLGWVLNLGAGANWFSGCFEPEVAKSLFTPSKTVIAGSGAENGTFEVKNSSIILNGSWSKCSGASHASYFSLNAKHKETGKVSSFVIPRESVEFSEEKWDIFGLKSTSSLTINLKEVEIPKDFGFQINSIKNHLDYQVFHIPFEQFARVCMSSCFIGIAQCFLNRLQSSMELNTHSKVKFEALQSSLFKAIRQLEGFAEEIQEQSNEAKLDDKLQEDLKFELGRANLLIFDQIQDVFKNAGLLLVEENQLSHWAYRDVLTAIQHPMMRA